MEMRSTFERVIEFEMTRLRTLIVEQVAFIEQQNATFQVVDGVDDSWSYPLDASFAEAGIDPPALWGPDYV